MSLGLSIVGTVFYALMFGFTHELIKGTTSDIREQAAAAVWPLFWAAMAGAALARRLLGPPQEPDETTE